jgi:hypothetical protein
MSKRNGVSMQHLLRNALDHVLVETQRESRRYR